MSGQASDRRLGAMGRKEAARFGERSRSRAWDPCRGLGLEERPSHRSLWEERLVGLLDLSPMGRYSLRR